MKRRAIDSTYGVELSGTDNSGVTKPVKLGYNNELKVDAGLLTSSFNELIQTGISPITRCDFTYDILSEHLIDTYTASGGSVTSTDGVCSLSIGTTLNAYAVLRSSRIIRYKAGIDNIIRFNCVFNTPVTGSTQRYGVGSAICELSLGYNGTSFGVLRAHSGRIHQVKFVVSAQETTTKTVTVTLNSVAYNVNLTDASAASNPKHFTAAQLAKGTYGGIWNAEQIGDTVFFSALGVGARSGTYSYNPNAGFSNGNFTNITTGVSLSEDWTYFDEFNGNADTLARLDLQKGNVFEIEYSDAFNTVTYSVIDPLNGRLEPLHSAHYASTSVTPSIGDTNMYIQSSLYSLSSTTAMSMKTTNFSAFHGIGEKFTQINPLHTVLSSKTLSAGVEKNILLVRPRYTLNGHINQANMEPYRFSFVADGTKSVTFNIYHFVSVSVTSTSDYPNWTYVDQDDSIGVYDVTSSTYSSATLILSSVLAKVESVNFELTREELLLSRDDVLLITATSAASSDVTVGLTFVDLY